MRLWNKSLDTPFTEYTTPGLEPQIVGALLSAGTDPFSVPGPNVSDNDREAYMKCQRRILDAILGYVRVSGTEAMGQGRVCGDDQQRKGCEGKSVDRFSILNDKESCLTTINIR